MAPLLFLLFIVFIGLPEIHVPTTQQTEWNHRTTPRNTVSSPFPLTSKSSEKNSTNSNVSKGQNLNIVDGLIFSTLIIVIVVRIWTCYRSKGQEDMRAKQAKSALARRI